MYVQNTVTHLLLFANNNIYYRFNLLYFCGYVYKIKVSQYKKSRNKASIKISWQSQINGQFL